LPSYRLNVQIGQILTVVVNRAGGWPLKTQKQTEQG
jgi:hypothetical protein